MKPRMTTHLLLLLLLVASSARETTGMATDSETAPEDAGRFIGDYCQGKDAMCPDGFHWLSVAYLVKAMPHSDITKGECAPCRSNEKTVVVPAKDAPDFIKRMHDWTHDPWTDTDKELPFYGVLWANGSYGELFNLGVCRDQSSWQKHQVCDIQNALMGLQATKTSQNINLWPFGTIWLSSAIYEPVDERAIEYIGKLENFYGFTYLTDFYYKWYGIYSYITIDDIEKDPNAWTQHWKGGPCYHRDGEEHCGFTGPYYKIIDAKGKRTEYFAEYLKWSEGRLYTYDKERSTKVFEIYTKVLLWKIGIALLFIFIGAYYYSCSSRNTSKDANTPGKKPTRATTSEENIGSAGSLLKTAFDFATSIGGDHLPSAAKGKKVVEQEGGVLSDESEKGVIRCFFCCCDEKSHCGTMSWLFFLPLASLLLFMTTDVYPRGPLRDEGMIPPCKFDNDYGSKFGLVIYGIYYVIAIVLAALNLRKLLPFGCCNCKKPTLEQTELATVDKEELESVRWIFTPLMFVIFFAHIGMTYARIGMKMNIATPVKLIICTVGQMWTLSWIQYFIGESKQGYRKTLKTFMQFVIFVMLLRVLVLSFSSDPGALYFALGKGCQRFYFSFITGAIIFIAVTIFVLIQHNQTRPMIDISDRCAMALRLCSCPLLVLIVLVGAVGFGQTFIDESLDICLKGTHCDVGSISIGDVGLKTALVYTLITKQTIDKLEGGHPSAEDIRKPYLVGGRSVHPIRQSVSGIRTSPVDEDNGDSASTAYITNGFFTVLTNMEGAVNSTVMNPAQRKAWQKYFEQKWPCGTERCEIVPGWSYELDTSDETINQFAFSGLAAHRLENIENSAEATEVNLAFLKLQNKDVAIIHKVDVSILESFEYRKGYEKNGGIAYYDGTSSIVCIKYNGVYYYPGHVDWKWIKWTFRSSVFLLVTAIDHLIGAHMLISGKTTLASEQFLLPDHPVRIFLKPFTHHSQYINWNAKAALFPEYGLLREATGFTSKGFDEMVEAGSDFVKDNAFNTAKKEKFSMENSARKNVNFTFGHDASAFIKIIEKYTETFVDTHFADLASLNDDKYLKKFWYVTNTHLQELTKTSLKKLLAYFIYIVTGYHQHVGILGQILKNPEIASWKVKQNEMAPSLQAAYQVMTIALATGAPQIELLSYHPKSVIPQFDPNRDTMIKAWDTFTAEMNALDAEIKELNKNRRFPCESFLPSKQGISIGV